MELIELTFKVNTEANILESKNIEMNINNVIPIEIREGETQNTYIATFITKDFTINLLNGDKLPVFNILIKVQGNNNEQFESSYSLDVNLTYDTLNISIESIYSDNEDKTLAKKEDTIFINIKTSIPIEQNEITGYIAGYIAKVTSSEDKMDWMIQYTISNSRDLKDNSIIPFSIEISNKGIIKTINESNSNHNITWFMPIEDSINSLEFYSNNKLNRNYAIIGDTLLIHLHTTHPVTLENVSISGMNIECTSNNGMDWTGKLLIGENEILDQTEIKFTLTIKDNANNEKKTYTNNDINKVTYYAPIKVSKIQCKTNNSSDEFKYAKDDNIITLEFSTNHEIAIDDIELAGNSNYEVFDISNINNDWIISYKIESETLNDLNLINYYINIFDKAGNIFQIREDSNITYYAPITLITSIQSNNYHQNFAKNGDTISVIFTPNHDVNIIDSKIFGRETIIENNNNLDFKFSYTLAEYESSLIQGVISFEYSVQDLAGNIAKVSKTNDKDLSKVTYDRTIPIASITPILSVFTNENVNFTITLSDSNINIDTMSLLLNGVEIIEDFKQINDLKTEYSLGICLDKEGEYEIKACFFDMAGNRNANEVIAKVFIDKTKPNLFSSKVELETPNVFESGFVISDYIEIDEKYVQEVICTLWDNKGVKDWKIDAPIIGDGKKTIKLQIRDMSNNTSVLTYEFYIDEIAPKPIIKELITGKIIKAGKIKQIFTSEVNLSISLDKNFIDNIDTPDQFTQLDIINEDSKKVTNLIKENYINKPYSYQLNSPGKYTIVVQAIDSCGNSTEKLKYSFTIKAKSYSDTILKIIYIIIFVICISLVTVVIIIKKIRCS